MELQNKDITEAIIGATFEVHNHLGYGFLEAVYKKAMKVELEARAFTAEVEPEMRVFYRGSRSVFTGPTSS
jgi:GxxExxY protein